MSLPTLEACRHRETHAPPVKDCVLEQSAILEPGRTSPAGRLERLRRPFEPVTQRLETSSGIGHRALR